MSEKLFSAARQELLSHLLANEGIEQTSGIRPLTERNDLPLSFAQERLWFLEQFKPGDPLYNCFQALLITGPLDARALELSLNEIVRRHDILLHDLYHGQRSADPARPAICRVDVAVDVPV